MFPSHTINFALYSKCFATPLTAKTQVNLLRTKETLVDAPHKAVEKA